MRIVLVLLALVAFVALASEFETGGAEMWKFNGYGIFRLDIFGQEEADPDMGFTSCGDLAWTPTLNDMLSAKAELLLNADGNTAQLADAYLDMTPAEGFDIRGGQFKRMFGWGYLEPTTAMLFPDRPLYINEDLFDLYGKRDTGLMLLGDFDMFTIDAAYTNGGAGDDAEFDSNKQFTIHGTVMPAEWIKIGAALGMYAMDSETEEDATVSSTGVDVYGLVEYPASETIDLHFTGEYMMLGAPVEDAEGMVNNDGTVMTIAGGATFGLQGDMITGITPMIRYEQISPATVVAEGDDAPVDNLTAIDFCANIHMGSHNTLQVGARNFGFEDENLDGYTNIIANWIMSF